MNITKYRKNNLIFLKKIISVKTFFSKKILAAVMVVLVCFGGYIVVFGKQPKQKVVLDMHARPIVLTGNTEQVYTVYEEYVAPIEYVYDDTLYIEDRVVEQVGEKGVKAKTISTCFYNGNKISERELEEEIIENAKPRIVHIGTKEHVSFIIPTENYYLSSDFGYRWGRMHKGIDLAVSSGTNVYAAEQGVVTSAGYVTGYGYCIDICHEEGYMTRYAHLSSIEVEAGQEVLQGEEIAKSGNTGNSTGPHLHFEIHINGEAVDPLMFLAL